MSELSEQELYEQEIKFYLDSGNCPKCNTEVEIIGMHERDSSSDRHRCPKCGWEIGEMQTWNRDKW